MKISFIFLATTIYLLSCNQNASVTTNAEDTAQTVTGVDNLSTQKKTQIAEEVIKIELRWADVIRNHDWSQME